MNSPKFVSTRMRSRHEGVHDGKIPVCRTWNRMSYMPPITARLLWMLTGRSGQADAGSVLDSHCLQYYSDQTNHIQEQTMILEREHITKISYLFFLLPNYLSSTSQIYYSFCFQVTKSQNKMVSLHGDCK